MKFAYNIHSVNDIINFENEIGDKQPSTISNFDFSMDYDQNVIRICYMYNCTRKLSGVVLNLNVDTRQELIHEISKKELWFKMIPNNFPKDLFIMKLLNSVELRHNLEHIKKRNQKRTELCETYEMLSKEFEGCFEEFIHDSEPYTWFPNGEHPVIDAMICLN